MRTAARSAVSRYPVRVKNQRNLLAVVVMLVGLVAVVVGVIYIVVQAHSLPSVLAPVHGFAGHRWKRGVVVLIVGAALLVGGGAISRSGRSPAG